MTNAGFQIGDLLIFQNASTAKNGDIVRVIADGKEMVKRYFRIGNQVALCFEDQKQAPIVLDKEKVVIEGKLTYIVKKVEGK